MKQVLGLVGLGGLTFGAYRYSLMIKEEVQGLNRQKALKGGKLLINNIWSQMNKQYLLQQSHKKVLEEALKLSQRFRKQKTASIIWGLLTLGAFFGFGILEGVLVYIIWSWRVDFAPLKEQDIEMQRRIAVSEANKKANAEYIRNSTQILKQYEIEFGMQLDQTQLTQKAVQLQVRQGQLQRLNSDLNQ